MDTTPIRDDDERFATPADYDGGPFTDEAAAPTIPHAYQRMAYANSPGDYCGRCGQRPGEAAHPLCEACELPAQPGDTYCRGHARLMTYTNHERSGGIAAND